MLDKAKVYGYELRFTHEIARVIAETPLSEETTVAAVAALANCLVLFTHHGLEHKEMTLDTVSAAVNRAWVNRDKIREASKLTFKEMPASEQK